MSEMTWRTLTPVRRRLLVCRAARMEGGYDVIAGHEFELLTRSHLMAEVSDPDGALWRVSRRRGKWTAEEV